MITCAQIATGLAGGYVWTFALMFAALIGARMVGLRPTTGDIAALAAVALLIPVTLAGAMASFRYRRTWFPMATAFAVSTTVTALFAILVVIPFSAGMRDFD